MIIKTRTYAFGDGEIRDVEIPDDQVTDSTEDMLEKTFFYGQDDFNSQPRGLRSLSVGDVIELSGEFYLIKIAGFRLITEKELELWASLSAGERSLHEMIKPL